MASNRYSGTLEKALQILQLFDVERNELGITEIAKLTDLSKSTVHRLVVTFEKYGYLTQDHEGGKYSLGLETYRLGQIATERFLIKRWGDMHVPKLIDQVGENVQIGMLNGLEVVNVAYYEGPKKLNFKFPVHKKAPACCIAMGKVLLSYNDVAIDKIVNSPLFKPYTANTIVDRDEYLKELKKVKSQGYAIDNEEYEEDVRCIATPIFDCTGKAIASLSISAPIFRMSPKELEKIIPILKETTWELSRAMGYKGDLF